MFRAGSTLCSARAAIAARGIASFGPNQQSAADYGAENLTHGISNRVTSRLWKSGKGCWIEDESGERFLDLASGIGVLNTGHCHPKVSAAAAAQCHQVVHAQVVTGYHEPMLRLIEGLQPILPGNHEYSFFFACTGAEAVENAVKVARDATGRPNIVVVQGGYHGRTNGTMAMTTSKTIYRHKFGPFMPGVYVTPFPYKSQMPPGIDEATMVEFCLSQFRLLLKQQTIPEQTAAFIIEPVLGEGGYVEAPVAYMQGMKKICEEHGIIFIVDEVQSGFGRTGDMFAFEQSKIEPDIICMAKGLASGFPLSAIAARKELMQQAPGSMGGTYAGNAVACAAAVATLEVFQEEQLLANAQARGRQFTTGLRSIFGASPLLEEVRGRGLMIGAEFKPGHSVAPRLAAACLAQKVVLLPTSAFDVVRFIPPLVITETEVDEALCRVQKAFNSL